MFSRRKLFLASWVSLFLLAVAHAKGPSSRAEEVLIIGTRLELGENDMQEQPGFSSRIELSPFESRFISAGAILERQRGIQISRFGGEGSFSSVSIRGSSGKQVSVLLDGIPLNLAASSTVDLSNISLEELDSIEVYRGVVPSIFGINPLGGAINLVSKKSEGETKGSVKLGVGSFNTRHASLSLSFSKKKWSFFFNENYVKSDGDYRYTDDRRTPNDPSDDLRKIRSNNDLEKNQLFFKVHGKLSKKVTVDLYQSLSQRDQGLSGRSNQQTQAVRYGLDMNATHLKLSFPKLSMSSGASIQFFRSARTDRFKDTFGRSGELGLGRQDQENDFKDMGFRGLWEGAFFQQIFRFGLGYRREDYHPNDHLLSLAIPNSQRDSYDFSVDSSKTFSGDKNLLTAGLAYQENRNHLFRESPGLRLATPLAHTQILSWQIGLSRQLTSKLKWKSNLNSSYRAPEFSELFGDRGVLRGNNDLLGEKGLGFDTGLESSGFDLGFMKEIHLLISVYQNDKKNLIQNVFDARGIGQAQNISKARLRGLEAEQDVKFFKFFHFTQNLSLIRSEILESPFSTDLGKDVPGVYEKTYTARVEFEKSSIKAFAEFIGGSGRFFDKSNLLKAADQSLYNVGFSIARKSTVFSLDIKNIGDRHHEDFAGWPLPGRSFLFSFRLIKS